MLDTEHVNRICGFKCIQDDDLLDGGKYCPLNEIPRRASLLLLYILQEQRK